MKGNIKGLRLSSLMILGERKVELETYESMWSILIKRRQEKWLFQMKLKEK